MATYKPQIKTNSGVEDIEIDASTLSGKDSSHYLNYNNLTNKPTVPTKTSQLTNDSGFKTTDTDTWRTISVNGTTIFGSATNTAGLNLQKGNNVTIEATAGSPNVKISATDTTYTFANGTNGFTVTPKGGTAQTVTVTPSIANATTSKAGLMSSTDKTNLDTLSNLLGDDSDAVVNKINEVIEIFDSYPEGDKIADALAAKQSKVAKLGSASKPVYVSADGTFAAASTYAGGTKVTLNGTDKGASTATIYAPTAVGTSGQILKSNGSGAPTWVAQSDLTVGHASSAGSATAATTANYATNDQLGNNIKDTYATKNETATARNIAAALNSAHVVNADGTLEAKYDGDGNEITATYAKKEYAVYYVEGNTTGTAGTWTGTNSDITSLYDGLVINYKVGIAGADTTKLNINGLGAKTCYLRGTTKITSSHYAVGTMILLSYNATTDAFYSADYDANSYAYVRQYKTTTNANYPMLFAYETSLPSSYSTKYTRMNSNITANPNTGTVSATSFIEDGTALSSKYLPLSGGNITGNLSVAGDLSMSGGGKITGTKAVIDEITVVNKLNLNNTKKITYDDTYEYTFPDKSGTVALLSDITSGGGSNTVTDLGTITEDPASTTNSVLNNVTDSGIYVFKWYDSENSMTDAYIMTVSTEEYDDGTKNIYQNISDMAFTVLYRRNTYTADSEWLCGVEYPRTMGSTTNSSNYNNKKLYLVGALSQGYEATTYSNSYVYIDAKNSLCSLSGGITVNKILARTNNPDDYGYTVGSTGQVLKTNGTYVYWDENTTDFTGDYIYLNADDSELIVGPDDDVYIDKSGISTPTVKTTKYYAPSSSGSSTNTVGAAGQVLMSNGVTSYWGTISTSGGGGNSSFIQIEDDSFSLESQSPMEIGLDSDLRNELIVYTKTQDGTYELSDDFGNTVSCEEIAVMHLNYMSEDGMLLGTMTSDTGESKPFISTNLSFFAESGSSIALRVKIYGR